MAAVVARNCLLAVLLTAAVSRADSTLADGPSSKPQDAPETLRCEPGPDFSAPTRPPPASPDNMTFDGIATDHDRARAEVAAVQGPVSPRHAGSHPARTWLFMRSSARTSVYLGLNRQGVAGLHFFQHAAASASIEQLPPRRDDG